MLGTIAVVIPVTDPATVASLGVEPLLVFGFYFSLAFAYLDPGTGSLILQALLGAIAAFAVAVTTFWARIRIFIARFRHRGESKSTTTGGPGHGGK